MIARPSVGNGLQFGPGPIAYLGDLRSFDAGGPCLMLSDLCKQKQAPWRRIAVLLAQSQDVAKQAFCSGKERGGAPRVVWSSCHQPCSCRLASRLAAVGSRGLRRRNVGLVRRYVDGSNEAHLSQ